MEEKNLDSGDSFEFIVDAKDFYSRTGVKVLEGKEYAFSFPPNQIWKDKGIECGPNGWAPEEQKKFSILKKLFFRLINFKKRCKEARWFEVIVTIGESEEHMIRVGDGSKTEANPWVCPKDGELYAFANDARRYYDNNKGQMKVNIKRIR